MVWYPPGIRPKSQQWQSISDSWYRLSGNAGYQKKYQKFLGMSIDFLGGRRTIYFTKSKVPQAFLDIAGLHKIILLELNALHDKRTYCIRFRAANHQFQRVQIAAHIFDQTGFANV